MHCNRSLRISQLKDEFVELMLDELGIRYVYRRKNRSYVITHYDNWIKFAKMKIADLHPKKKNKFWQTYSDFKEYHYRTGYLKAAVYALVGKPYSTKGLSLHLKRTPARIYDVLSELKKEGKVMNYQVHSKNYWIRSDQNIIIISDVKKNYLNFLKRKNRRTSEIANYFNVGYKSSHKRLKELEYLGLVKRKKDKTWRCIKTNKKVLVL